ncbi:MAG: tRNA uracil 4-sulfurtransferase ThiI [Malacoplasma sp.]
MKIFIIKFADLWLKGSNRNEFVNVLFANIKKAISEYKTNLEKKFDRFHLSILDSIDEEKIISILKFIPGISLIVPTWLIINDIDEIKKTTISILDKEIKTFKIEAKREKKDFPLSSYEIKTTIASAIINELKYVVDVHKPTLTIDISIKLDCCYLSFLRYRGVGGLPIGINGSTLSLISGGIDSAVSSFLMQNKGLEVHYLLFIENNDTSKLLIEKIRKIINLITLDNKIFTPKLFIVNFDSVQQELAHARNKSYRINLMRRSFYRIAAQIAILNHIDSLTSGDSLGQVASQTLESLQTISKATDMLIFRPLLGFEKNEIILIARKINTYNISITQHNDICSNFNPENPITRPKIEFVNSLENELPLLFDLEKSAIQNMKQIEV